VTNYVDARSLERTFNSMKPGGDQAPFFEEGGGSSASPSNNLVKRAAEETVA